MGTASAQNGAVGSVIKLKIKPAGSLAICDFASSGRIGSSLEAAVAKGAPSTRVEAYSKMSPSSLVAAKETWLATDEGRFARSELKSGS